MKRFLLRPTRGAGRRRAGLILYAALSIILLSAVTASSASAFEWWVGNGGSPMPLGEHNKLPINSGGSVKAPFTLKWLHKFEVKCKGITYDNLFLEGPAALGATSIVFEQCEAKKPKKATLVGGKVESTELTGTIKPGTGEQVEFDFAPGAGPTLASFVIEAPKKRHHHRSTLQCTYEVQAAGSLSGNLGDARNISTEKTFEFASKSITFTSSRSCVAPPGPSKRVRRHNSASQVASASLTLRTAKGPLSSGAEIKAFSSNARFVSETGTVECEEDTLFGTLDTNGANKDHVTIAADQAQGNFEGFPGACKAEFSKGELEPVLIQARNLPWTEEVAGTGKGEIKGSVDISSIFPGENECTYGTGAIKAVNSVKGPLTLTVSNQTLKLVPGGSPACPTLAQIDGTFTVTSEGEPVEAETGAGQKETEEEEQEQKEEEQEEIEEGEPKPIEGNKGKSTYSATEGWGVQ